MNGNNGLPPKQINRVATPIKLDENGNKIEEEKKVVNKKTKIDNHDPSTMIFITVLLIILAVLCFFVFYFVLPDYIESRNNELEYNDGTTTTAKVINNSFTTLAINNGKTINNDGTFRINNNYQITTVNKNGTLDILVNNKKITSAVYLLPTIGFVDDLILFSVQNNEERTTKLFSVDQNGNIVLELYNFSNADGMVLLPDSSSVIYNSVSIVLLASRVNGSNLILDSVFENKMGINLCNNDELNSKNIDDNFIAMANYSLEYLGDHQFSEPTKISDVTLGEYKSRNQLCKDS